MNSNYLKSSQPAKFVSTAPPGQTEHGWTNVRGYGTITLSGLKQNNIEKQTFIYNRLQPLAGPFAKSLPPNCTGGCQPSSETTIGWACNHKQNHPDEVFRVNHNF